MFNVTFDVLQNICDYRRLYPRGGVSMTLHTVVSGDGVDFGELMNERYISPCFSALREGFQLLYAGDRLTGWYALLLSFGSYAGCPRPILLRGRAGLDLCNQIMRFHPSRRSGYLNGYKLDDLLKLAPSSTGNAGNFIDLGKLLAKKRILYISDFHDCQFLIRKLSIARDSAGFIYGTGESAFLFPSMSVIAPVFRDNLSDPVLRADIIPLRDTRDERRDQITKFIRTFDRPDKTPRKRTEYINRFLRDFTDLDENLLYDIPFYDIYGELFGSSVNLSYIKQFYALITISAFLNQSSRYQVCIPNARKSLIVAHPNDFITAYSSMRHLFTLFIDDLTRPQLEFLTFMIGQVQHIYKTLENRNMEFSDVCVKSSDLIDGYDAPRQTIYGWFKRFCSLNILTRHQVRRNSLVSYSLNTTPLFMKDSFLNAFESVQKVYSARLEQLKNEYPRSFRGLGGDL